jgi:DNA invertase Pin-like site-specific DNA recombinase
MIEWTDCSRSLESALQAARTRGRIGGRRRALTPKEVVMVRRLAEDKSGSITDLCRQFKVSRATLYRYLKGKASVIG